MTEDPDPSAIGKLMFMAFLTDTKSLVKWAIWVTYPEAPISLCSDVAAAQMKHLYGAVVGNRAVGDVRVESPRIFRSCVKWMNKFLNREAPLCDRAQELLMGYERTNDEVVPDVTDEELGGGDVSATH